MYSILNTFFQKIYVITCFELSERHEFIKKQFDDLKLNYEFVIAPDQYMFQENYLSVSEQSLVYAHTNSIKNAIIKNYKQILICEDDVFFNKTLSIIDIQNFLLTLPKDWNFLQLGNQEWAEKWLQREKVSKNLYRFFHGTGSHCIGIRNNVYKNIIKSLESGEYPADFAYYSLYKDYICYCPEKFIADALSKNNHLNYNSTSHIFESTIFHKNSIVEK
jgi:GR25 family glycosyltransferase involved in LPS biosynthesis